MSLPYPPDSSDETPPATSHRPSTTSSPRNASSTTFFNFSAETALKDSAPPTAVGEEFRSFEGFPQTNRIPLTDQNQQSGVAVTEKKEAEQEATNSMASATAAFARSFQDVVEKEHTLGKGNNIELAGTGEAASVSRSINPIHYSQHGCNTVSEQQHTLPRTEDDPDGRHHLVEAQPHEGQACHDYDGAFGTPATPREHELSVLDKPKHDISMSTSPGFVVIDHKLDDLINCMRSEDDITQGKDIEDNSQSAADFSTQINASSPDSIRCSLAVSPLSPMSSEQNFAHTPVTPTPTEASLQQSSAHSSGKRSSASMLQCGLVPTRLVRHVSFQEHADATDETPFTKTLKYFQTIKGKENSPTKSRRNASLPEEIAELAKEACRDSDDDQDLDRFRHEDLAPLDLVIETEMAGDIIVSGVPTPKMKSLSLQEAIQDLPQLELRTTPSPRTLKQAAFNEPLDVSSSTEIKLDVSSPWWTDYAFDIPGPYGDTFKVRIEGQRPIEAIAHGVRTAAKHFGASSYAIDEGIKGFLANPGAYIVNCYEEDSGLGEDTLANPATHLASDNLQTVANLEHPVFINVIGMLPTAMVAAVMKPIAYYVDKAFDMALERLVGLNLGG